MARTRTRDQVDSPADDSSAENSELAQANNRSARRKSTRHLIERSLANPPSEESDEEEEELLAVDVLGVDDSSLDEDSQNGEVQNSETLSKARHRRTKKQSTKRRDQESPPRHLPPHERYFWDNRSGASKTSEKVLPPNLLLNHDDYFAKQDAWSDTHQGPRDFLLELHRKAFHQWAFELRNDFNLCLYGYGSKRAALAAFAQYLHEEQEPSPTIVIVNGFRPDITLLDILITIASTLLPPHVKLPSVPSTLLTLLLETLDAKPPSSPLHLLINSIDASSLRRGNSTQFSLASLAAHPSVRLIASADTPNFLQLWDASLRTRLRFLFHDCTTFAPFDAEIDVVESVNELLGRSGRRLGGRDGVGYVLRSLPENARHLFRILVAEQIVLADEGDDSSSGVEYRILYQKAREELVCSTEHQLQTLLKEFYDHQMVESRRDGLGTERLLVPFRKDELESLLHDLVE